MVEDPVLVGENRTLLMDDDQLDSIYCNHGFLAAGVLLGDNDLVVIASLCMIEACTASKTGFEHRWWLSEELR
jgi:hypothetical protein